MGSNPTPRALDEGLYDNFKVAERDSEPENYKTADMSTLEPQLANSTSISLLSGQGLKQSQDPDLRQKIDIITADIGNKFAKRLERMLQSGGEENVAVLCDYIIAEQNEVTIKPSTKEGKLKVALRS